MALCKQLKDLINAWTDSYSSRNLSFLAKSSGVDVSILSRIVNKEDEKAIQLETFLSIAQVVADRRTLNGMIREYFPRVVKLFDVDAPEQWREPPPDNFGQVVGDRTTWLIFNLASCANGTTDEEIKEKAGDTSTGIVKQMVLDGLITDEGNCYKTAETYALTNYRHILMEQRHMADLYDPDNIGKGAIAASFQEKGLNTEGEKALYENGMAYIKRCDSIFKNPEFKGMSHHLTFCGIIQNRI